MKPTSPKDMPIVYVAGPYRAANTWLIELNIREAEARALYVAGLEATPLCPHSMTRFFHGTITENYWCRATMNMLAVSDIIWLGEDWIESPGSVAEREFAIMHNIPRAYNKVILRGLIEAWHHQEL